MNEQLLRIRAEAGERDARFQSYLAEVNLGFKALGSENLANARALIDKQIPSPGAPDFRGPEWRLLWQLARSTELSSLNIDGVYEINLSPNGRILAASTEDALVLFDMVTRRKTSSILGKAVTVSFAPTGETFAVGGKSVRVFKTALPEQFATLTNALPPARFSPDGTSLLTASKNGFVLWNTVDWSQERLIPVSWGAAYWDDFWDGFWSRDCTKFSPSGNFIVIPAVEDGQLEIHQLTTTGGASPRFGKAIYSLVFLDENHLITGDYYGTIALWSLPERRIVRSVKAHSAWICRLVLSADRKTLYSASADQTLAFWDTATFFHHRRIRSHTSEIWGLALTPDGLHLLTGGSFETNAIKFWDPAELSPPGVYRGDQIVCGFTDQGRKLVSAGDTNLTLIDLATGRRTFFPGDIQEVFSTAVGLTNQLAWLGRTNGNVRTYDLSSGAVLHEWHAHPKRILSLAVSDNERWLVTGSESGVRIWDLTTGKWAAEIPESDEYINDLSVSDDGNSVLIARGTGAFYWRPSENKISELAPHLFLTTGSALSPDATFGSTTSEGGEVFIWALPDTRKLAHLRTHITGVFSVGFFPDLKSLFSVSEKALRFTELKTFRETGAFPIEGSCFSAKLSPGGTAIALGIMTASGNEIRVLQIPKLSDIQQ